VAARRRAHRGGHELDAGERRHPHRPLVGGRRAHEHELLVDEVLDHEVLADRELRR
jgi:hypothetical protein